MFMARANLQQRLAVEIATDIAKPRSAWVTDAFEKVAECATPKKFVAGASGLKIHAGVTFYSQDENCNAG